MKQLVAYVLEGHDFHIRPAPLERPWMDETAQRFAYRCLPLNIANTHGWEILCTSAFSAIWDGRPTTDAVRVEAKLSKESPPGTSHFGDGILTFHVPCLFRTEPGTDLFVMGPVNRPKDGIAPLSGVIETDWSPYTFTMNWKFTRPNHEVHFDIDEPFCHIFPVQRGSLENIVPTIRKLSDKTDLEREHYIWSRQRNAFIADLANPASKATKDKWQKGYFRGVTPSGSQGPDDHQTKLRLQPFEERVHE